jgi:hypothetical protein
MAAGRTAPVKTGAVAVFWIIKTALVTGLLLFLFLAGGAVVFACCAYHPVSAFCEDPLHARRLFYTGWRIDGMCQAPDRS